MTFGNAPVPSHQVCAGQDVVVDFAAGSHNIREYDPATFNVFNPVYLGDAYSARLSGTHTVSGLGASPGGTRHYICAYHETAKFDTECVHTPDDAPLLECLDVACDNGAAQTLCSGDEMSVGLQTGAIALTLTSEFAVPPPPPPPPPIVYGTVTTIAQLGADIDGETLGDFFGESVAFNSDGTIFAAGALDQHSSNSNGRVRAYQLSGNSWTPLGENIHGESNNDRFGGSVALNADGLAIGATL